MKTRQNDGSVLKEEAKTDGKKTGFSKGTQADGVPGFSADVPDARYFLSADSHGERAFLLFESARDMNKALEALGYAPIADGSLLVCDTSLPQDVRDEAWPMASTRGSREDLEYPIRWPYILEKDTDRREGKVYVYTPSNGSASVPLKYLRPLAVDGVEVEINGDIYTYFMTNTLSALEERLFRLGCLLPGKEDCIPNPVLHKHVIDKMEELGALYSIPYLINGKEFQRMVINAWDERENIPVVSFIDELRNKHRSQIRAGFISRMINADDAVGLEKYFQSNPDIEGSVVSGYSPLMLCAWFDSASCARLLLRLGANVDARGSGGLTALMVAAGRGSVKVLDILLESGADRSLRAENGWNSYVHAMAFRHEEEAMKLAEYDTTAGSIAVPKAEAALPTEKMSFQDRLHFYIARFTALGDRKVSEIYQSLGPYMTRQTFSKLQSKTARPSKDNCILLSIGLHLDLEDAEALLMSAGHVLKESDVKDSVVLAHLREQDYDIDVINSEIYEKTKRSLMNPRRKEYSDYHE